MNLSDIFTLYIDEDLIETDKMNVREDKLVEQGRRIQAIIEKEGLTQAEFSQITGIKTSTLNHVIKGRNNISPFVMQQLKTAFPQYSEEWIRTGFGEMEDKNIRVSSDNLLQNQVNQIPAVNNGIMQPQLFNLPEATTENKSTTTHQMPSNPQTHNYEVIPSPLSVQPRKITKIIVYYDDNTFETFTQS